VSDRNVRRLALGTILAGFEGDTPPDWLRRRLGEGLGGAVLFARNVHDDEQVGRLVSAVHGEAPAVVAIDEEGGDVTRLDARTGSACPGHLVLGTVGDVALTRAVAAELGARLARAGIDLDLAPVADLLVDPMSPIVGVRSFGSDPARAGAQVSAFVAGLQAQGVGASLKHFPGHGATAGDSHHVLPEVSAGALESALEPFRAGIAAGARAVMTAHIRIPELDAQPATVSPRIIGGLLCGGLGFEGLVVSDGLDMGGITSFTGGRPAGPMALAAGVDALCLGGGPAGDDDIERTVASILAAVESGALPVERLAQAADRVRALAAWASMARRSAPATAPGAGAEAARRAIRVTGRVEIASPVTVLELAVPPSEAAGPVPLALAGALADLGLDVASSVIAEGSPDPGDGDGRDLVVVVRDLHRHPWQQAALRRVLARRPDAVVIDVGVPQLEVTGARGRIDTFGASRVSCQAAAAVMAGSLVKP
jgi:beta-N-acetylhexosaminidase